VGTRVRGQRHAARREPPRRRRRPALRRPDAVTPKLRVDSAARHLQPRHRRWIHAGQQALAFAVLGGLLFLMFHVTSANLAARGVRSGVAFLSEPAKTPVSDAPIAMQPGVDSYAKAFIAGALNSLKLAAAT